MWSPAQLYALVEGYARLGDHRTGTAVDHATLTWLTGELVALGADVTHDLYAFDRYAAAAAVLLDGRPVGCLPLWYSATGTVHDAAPGRAALAPATQSTLEGLPAARDRAAAEGRRALVVATVSGYGGLFALNQHPSAAAGLPVLLVAEEDASALASAAVVEARLDARLEPGFSSNLLASWGGAPHVPHLLVTTPLTGWFGCAGERGTGLALAIDLAATLARDWPVLLLGATGHELEHLGAEHHLAQGRPAPAAVLHLGASAAAAGPVAGRLSEHVQVAVAAVDPASFTTGHSVHDAAVVGWRGEARQWAAYGVPTVSVAGATHLFHTPQDLLPAATTPALLAQVRDGLLAGATALASSVLRPRAAAARP